MNRADVIQSLENIKTIYKKELQANNVITSGDEVTWRNYRAGIHAHNPYIQEYRSLLDAQQYSFLLSNNAFLQLYYSFSDNGELKKAKLAFYPPPQSTKVTIDELYEDFADANEWLLEMLFEQVQDLQGDEKFVNTSHIRFDFDSKVTSHYKAHLQFGGINDFRMGSEKIPLPFTFLDIMLSAFDADARGQKLESQQYKSAISFDSQRFFHSEEANKELMFITCEG